MVKFICKPIQQSLTQEIYLMILFRTSISFTWEQIIIFTTLYKSYCIEKITLWKQIGVVMNALIVHPKTSLPLFTTTEKKEAKSKVSIMSIYMSTYLFQISQTLSERFSPAPCAGCHTTWTPPPLFSAEEPSSDRSTEANPCGC